jgi:hypothetical protein
VAALGDREGPPLAQRVPGLEDPAGRAVDQRRVQHAGAADLEGGELVGVGLEGGGLEVALRARQRRRRVLAGRPQPVDAAQDEAAGQADQVEHRVAGGEHGPGRPAAAVLLGLGRVAQAPVLRVDGAAAAGAVLRAHDLVPDQAPAAARDEPRPAEDQEAGRHLIVGAVDHAEREVRVDRSRGVFGRRERAGPVGEGECQGRSVSGQAAPLGLEHREHGLGQRAAAARGVGPGRRRRGGR